jgi:hypothetical protein
MNGSRYVSEPPSRPPEHNSWNGLSEFAVPAPGEAAKKAGGAAAPTLSADLEALRALLATMRTFSTQVNSTATIVQPFRQAADDETQTGSAAMAQGAAVDSGGVEVGAARGGRTMNRAEIAFIVLVKDIKATLEVRDTILAKREELAELTEEFNKLRDGVHATLDEIREDGSYAIEVECIRADFNKEVLDATPETAALTAGIEDLLRAQLALMPD